MNTSLSDNLKSFKTLINDTSYTPSSSIKIATILDQFSYNCFKYEAILLQLTSENFIQELEFFNPDFLFVESAWRGKDDSWNNLISSSNGRISEELNLLIDYCNKKNIKTVFWNKEGLANFDYFKESSSLFDFVFLTDENIIDKQLDVTNIDNIFLLPFAAQPKLHNSIGKNNHKLGSIAFAGAWYGPKHPDRLEAMENILEPALKYDLHIFDRNFSFYNELVNTPFYWPDIYLNNILSELSYEECCLAYRNYDIFLNVNSITNSAYMISRRVYEILASKTLVISSFSKGILHQFNTLIPISNSKDETEYLLNYYLSNKLLLKAIGKKSQRFVLSNHTYSSSLKCILQKIGLNNICTPSIRVCILTIVNNLSQFKKLSLLIKNQTYKNFKVYVLYKEGLDFIEDSPYGLSYIKTTNPNLDIEKIVNCSSFDYYCLLNYKYYYSPNYILDYIHDLTFAPADIIGKNTIFHYNSKLSQLSKLTIDNIEDDYCNNIFLYSLFISCSALSLLINNQYDFEANTILSLSSISNKLLKFYSDDSLGLCYLSDEVNLDQPLKLSTEYVFTTNDFKTYMDS